VCGGFMVRVKQFKEAVEDEGSALLWHVKNYSCQVKVSVVGQSLVQRNPTKCGVSEHDLETSTRRRPRPNRAVQPWKWRSILILSSHSCVGLPIELFTPML
jgi:hypothetical protein